MVRKILCALFLFALGQIDFAQEGEKSITGVVRKVDGSPLGNAMCRLLNAKDSLLAFAQTKADGTYVFATL